MHNTLLKNYFKDDDQTESLSVVHNFGQLFLYENSHINSVY